jgi:hypothetical protein
MASRRPPRNNDGASARVGGMANEYLVGRFRWSRVLDDLQEEILRHASIEVVQRDEQLRNSPVDLADMAAYPFLFAASQEYVFSRARKHTRVGQTIDYHVQ